ncbi:MAG: phosphoenolpyruvate--protein phosphotransferase [Nocardioidaceae bacterium]
MTTLRGLGVSAGLAAGPAVVMAAEEPEPPATYTPTPVADRDAAGAVLEAAAKEVERHLLSAAEAVEGEARAVLHATAMMAVDPMLLDQAVRLVREQGMPADRAVWVVAAEVTTMFSAAGAQMAARVRDVNDVRDRLVYALHGTEPPGVPSREQAFVLVARDLAPSDTVGLDPDKVLALVTEEGGPTSHTAILARALGIPSVVAAAGVLKLREGAVVVVDGTSGLIEVEPDAARISQARRHRVKQLPRHTGEAATADGHPVPLLANIGEPADAKAALEAGAEGVGLFRTEFCFFGRTEPPSLDEQITVYQQLFDAFAGGRVVVRTLDAGADKPMPFMNVAGAVETNPALGVRGYRTAIGAPDLLDVQLEALSVAAQRSEADVWVMAPMVSTAIEASEFAALARQHGLRTAGIMVEVPAIALAAKHALSVCDFASIGTNDLTQYAMAADRQLAAVAALNDPWQPAVLRLVAETCTAGRELGKPIGVCGEAAAEPGLACVLVGLGVSSLSMSPSAISAVASRLSGVSSATCSEAATAALAASSAEQARQDAYQLLDEGDDGA